MALKEAIRSRTTRPPNLRQGTSSRSCGTCQFFRAGKCSRYGGFRVGAGQVCDSWAPTTNTMRQAA